MAAVLSLVHIPRRPGSFQQDHMARPVEGETQTPRTEGGQKQVAVSLLEPVHRQLTLRWTLATDQQLTPEALLQQLQGFDESTEQNHCLATTEQLADQLNCRRQLEFSRNPAQTGEQRQRFGIGTHLTQGGPPSVLLKNQIHPMIETQGFGLSQSNGVLAALLGRQVKNL